jgi:hypothetical protein
MLFDKRLFIFDIRSFRLAEGIFTLHLRLMMLNMPRMKRDI